MRNTFALLLLLLPLSLHAAAPADPALVVVVVFDQYPYEYLQRFRPVLHGGLARLLTEGANFTNTNYRHAQCLTGPGHAVIMSGTYGNVNGIIANTWYDRATHKPVYCAQDDSVRIIGGNGGGRSPRLYRASSLGDAWRDARGSAVKVVSLSNKDRAAILMGGRHPNEVFWLADSNAVTSSYYMSALPSWVEEFNHSGIINACFDTVWRSTLPESAFAGLDPDDVPYEEGGNGMGRTFPHRIAGTDRTHITPSFYPALTESPYGAMALAELARRAIVNERLGQRGVTDILSISFSSTDYVGHAFGPDSHEALEMTHAMDDLLGSFFAFLDTTVGLQHCLIAFTSDHGVAPIPEHVLAHNHGKAAGRVADGYIHEQAEKILTGRYGVAGTEGWIEGVVDHNIYLRLDALQHHTIAVNEAAAFLSASLRTVPRVASAWVFDSTLVRRKDRFASKIALDRFPGRSGDVFYILSANFLEGGKGGTSHGDPYPYNTHVPLIFMGKGIRPGTYAEAASPSDLAPTLARLLGIRMPGSVQGRALTEALQPFTH